MKLVIYYYYLNGIGFRRYFLVLSRKSLRWERIFMVILGWEIVVGLRVIVILKEVIICFRGKDYRGDFLG